MPNSVYEKAKQAFGLGQINWADDDIRVVLVDTEKYGPDFVDDRLLSDVPKHAILCDPVKLENKSCEDGRFLSDGFKFEELDEVKGIRAALIYKHENNGDVLIMLLEDQSVFPISKPIAALSLSWDKNGRIVFKW